MSRKPISLQITTAAHLPEFAGQGLDSSPEEIHAPHPHLSLAQIHAALGCYYDHREELDAEAALADARYSLRYPRPTPSPLR